MLFPIVGHSHQQPDPLCAPAASGHAAAAPPSSVMNARRLMGCPPQTGSRTLPHRYAKTLLCITAKLIVEWQRWVMNGPKATCALSPFDSQLRTLFGAARRSHSCHQPTFAAG